MRVTRIIVAAALILLPAVVVQAIYPDTHWQYSTMLNDDTFESHIQVRTGPINCSAEGRLFHFVLSPSILHLKCSQEQIDAGKTVFVRWIASPQ
jgi:hypothetical protein